MEKYKIIENGIEYSVVKHNNRDIHYYLDGKLHRENGPAIFGIDGLQTWYKHGKVHREDGPAVIYSDGFKQYFLHGKYYNVNSIEELIIASIIT
jgi:hypothetical protein